MKFSSEAAETIRTYLEDTDRKIFDFDYIFTGDLGEIGSKLLIKILNSKNLTIADKEKALAKYILQVLYFNKMLQLFLLVGLLIRLP